MLLKIGAAVSGEDLGYLLHKNPARAHAFDLAFGKAHVFYTRLGEDHAEAALLLDVDPIGLVRSGRQTGGEGALDHYVNDRPYAASSFLSVALSRVFGTAMSGKSKERQELADQPLDLEATIAALPCQDGEAFLRSLFEPLGYAVSAERHPLDEQFPEWGDGPYWTARIQGRARLRDLLTHIYVLVPALDAEKHYWVGPDEVEKLLRKGEGWLASHPRKEAIAAGYLRYDRTLIRDALARLVDEDSGDPEAEDHARRREEADLETPLRLAEQRTGAVLACLRAVEARSVVDLGCGEGKLLKALLEDRSLERIAGMDVSWRSIEAAQRRLRLHQMPPAQRGRIELIHGSLLYSDKRLTGFDAATVVEVIEHLDPPRLAAFERVVFERAAPRAVVVTTPNFEYNVKFPALPANRLRHRDHRFEWTRPQFAVWAAAVADRFGYSVRFLGIGPEDFVAGPPTQMGVFAK
ncbi:MAG: 3' terminal RNA ribose 2'-O-methyltransferase Hen1 [Bryobacteraceae bacterium]|nr:3' terminal RNA ribose 2'-O-methyltransferase Hen1 [Bryobacteraceae bacterium]